MRLFGGGGPPEDPAAKQRREDSERSLEQGGLPLNAVDRLREQAARQGTPRHLFTSDLSVNELTLVLNSGYDPLGQVMGSSVYHVGWQYMSGWSGMGGELTVLTQAFYSARHLALGRLQQEAALLGATGVVGVRLEHQEYDWGAGLLEFKAIGTAIRERQTEEPQISLEHPLQIGKPGKPTPPFLSSLSGQEFWMVRRGGYRPLGIAVGNCTYYQVATWRTQQALAGGLFGGGWQNQELVDYTQALYDARSLAMGRMEAEARGLGAAGVLGADVEVKAEPFHVDSGGNRQVNMMFHYTAIGTAVEPYTYVRPPFSPGNAVPLR